MAHTFLYTTKIKGRSAAIRFVSETPTTKKFKVTVLSDPAIPSFTMHLEDGDWYIDENGCLVAGDMQEDLREVARMFQR